MKVLITGILGSGGSYLAEYILAEHPGTELHGFARWRTRSDTAPREGITLHEVDLCDLSSIIRGLEKARPEVLFHLASHANVRACFDTPLAVFENNTRSTACLLEALRLTGQRPRFVMCSTSEVYGPVKSRDVPIKETCAIQPSNPYAVSKLAQDALAQCYHLCYGLPVVRTRMFSYINPRRSDLFSTAFARQIVRIERGEQKELLHGNLDSIRTLIDVRDIVTAYWAALRCMSGEAYNIGGEEPLSVGDFLERLKTYARCPINARLDEQLLRPNDVTLQIPDVSKFKKATGWQPRYTLEQSIEHLMEHCRCDHGRMR